MRYYYFKDAFNNLIMPRWLRLVIALGSYGYSQGIFPWVLGNREVGGSSPPLGIFYTHINL